MREPSQRVEVVISVRTLMVLGLHWVPQGAWQWAVLFYVLASVGYFWGNVFGDSMLVAVAEPGKLDLTSAIGYFAGYLAPVEIACVALGYAPQRMSVTGARPHLTSFGRSTTGSESFKPAAKLREHLP